MHVILAFYRDESRMSAWLDFTGKPFPDSATAKAYADNIMSSSPHWDLNVVELCWGPLPDPRGTPIPPILMEARINQAGYFLRDDRPLREGVEAVAGYEEAYSLHTVKPFQRHHVYAGKWDWAVGEAYKHVFAAEIGDPNEQALAHRLRGAKTGP